MRKSRYIIAMGAALSALVTLAGTSAQTPPQQSGKPSATQQKPSGPERLSGAAADDTVLVATGKPAVDKATVKAREESEEAANQRVSEGEAYFKAGKIKAALASYHEALVSAPFNGLVYQRLAEAYTAAGQPAEASQTFHKLLVEGFGPGESIGIGDTPTVWAEYALVLVKTHQDAEAIQAYNHAASLLDYKDSKSNGGKPTLKVLLPELVAERTLPDQVRYTPERLQALADAAIAYDEMGFGSEKEAIAHMKEAATLYPDSGAVQYYLGEALSRSHYVYLYSPLKNKAAALAACQEDEKAMPLAYKKAVELGDDATIAAAKERISLYRRRDDKTQKPGLNRGRAFFVS